MSDLPVPRVAWNDDGFALPDMPSWWATAACQGLSRDDYNVFFPERGASANPAKAVCARCAARHDCLSWALANLHGPSDIGVWGGTTLRERRRMRRARQTGRPVASARQCEWCLTPCPKATSKSATVYCSPACRQSALAARQAS